MTVKTLVCLAGLVHFCSAAAVLKARQQQPYYGLDNPQTINASRNNDAPVSITISLQDQSKRNATAPYLYGLMFEDISHSGDGGIYAELIRNRAFQGSDADSKPYPYVPNTDGWAGIGGAKISLDRLHPLSDALRNSLRVDIPANATGEVGIMSYGWWGMDVSPQTYNLSFYVSVDEDFLGSRSDGYATFTASLRSNSTGKVFASKKLGPHKLDYFDYQNINGSFYNEVQAPDGNNTFALTMNATEVAGLTFYFSLVSLFPETFKGRKNGLRKDLASALNDMKPRFLRFPGGNNMEGNSQKTRWKWWETVGDLKSRPGRPGTWSYYNTDGLGLLEYLEWCEDMNMVPLLGIYAGYSLSANGGNGTDWPQDRMGQVLQEALDELEYCMGGTDTKYGALRASHGHPKPFDIKFVEIGNEDWFSYSYPRRFPYLLDGLKKAYPDITYISTASNENAKYTIRAPPGTYFDLHHYETPSFFVERFDEFDNWQERTGNQGNGVLLGEYSVFQIDTPSGVINYSAPIDNHVFFPQLVSALAEGVYALGAERNPNTVKLSSYAPSFMNRNQFAWTPDMISFIADARETVLSSSYWQQWLFSHYHGTQTLPVKISQGDYNPLFWVASLEASTGSVYLKIINVGTQAVPLTMALDMPYSKSNGTIITAPALNSFNFVNNKTEVVPRSLSSANLPSPTKQASGAFLWSVPKWSITVLEFTK